MKTIEQLKSEKDKLQKYIFDNLEYLSKAELSKYQKEKQRIGDLLIYLESNPNEAIIKSKDEQYDAIIAEEERFAQRSMETHMVNKKRAEHRKTYNYALLKEQAKNLNYLLS